MIGADLIGLTIAREHARDAGAEATLAQNRLSLPDKTMSADKAAKDFEAMFISAMLEPMFGESLGEGLFGDSDSEEVYKTILLEEYGRQITRSGGIGVADYVKRELLKLQEV